MKKLIIAGAVVFGSISLYSCDGGGGTTTTEDEGTVIDSDTSVSELEVEKTVRDVDTTIETQTETIEPQQKENQKQDNQ